MTEASPSLPPWQRDVSEPNDNDNREKLNNDPPVFETYNNPFDSQNSDPETQTNEYLQQELIETLNLSNTQTELRTSRPTDNISTVHTEQLQLAPSTSRRAPPMQTSGAETQVPFCVAFQECVL